MAGSSFAGPIGLDRDPSLAFINRARMAIGGGSPTGERPIETRLRTLQATAGNAAVGQMLQREVAGGAGNAEAPAPSHSLLQYGAVGDDVRDLQARLNQTKATRPALVIDGVFGRKTQAAVRLFQRAHPPLAIDGDAGPETWTVLERVPATKTGGQGAEAGGGAEQGTPAVDPFDAGKAHYEAGRYGQAYDEFTKAYERNPDPAFIWNRAQSLRLLGGRRDEAIALYEQFVGLDIPDVAKSNARGHIAELRGPGRSTDADANKAAVASLNKTGAELYAKGEYARAYDEFTKAYEVTGEAAMLWNRAQALRLLGGRRSETIALYEQLLATDVGDEKKAAARREIADLRGPGRSADEAANKSAVDILFKKGQDLFREERYPEAYDEFSKAHEISNDPALLYNRAQARRLEGGRRAEAIALFEQFIAANVPEDAKKAAKAHLEDLRGQDRKPEAGATKLP